MYGPLFPEISLPSKVPGYALAHHYQIRKTEFDSNIKSILPVPELSNDFESSLLPLLYPRKCSRKFEK